MSETIHPHPMIFVFGSNEAGHHGRGAAKTARELHGAVYGKGVGHFGNSYAIPTKSRHIRVLPLDVVQKYVERFIEYAQERPDLEFQVTAIGTGLAGLKHEDMAPMFKSAPSNCYFDTAWEKLLPGKKFWGTYEIKGRD
jgi:hypothetical protein